jgi:hypothetical protein
VRPRICVNCEHFNYNPGDPGYSEQTGGWSATIECKKGHWPPADEDRITPLRKKLNTATECTDYVEFSEEQ